MAPERKFQFNEQYYSNSGNAERMKKEIENLDIPFVDYTVETNANGANIKLDGPWAGFRSGFSLGYRF